MKKYYKSIWLPDGDWLIIKVMGDNEGVVLHKHGNWTVEKGDSFSIFDSVNRKAEELTEEEALAWMI